MTKDDRPVQFPSTQIADQVAFEFRDELDTDDPNGPDISPALLQHMMFRTAHLTAEAVEDRKVPTKFKIT